jgi:adenine-specific DNA-methyltransferase
MGKPPNDLVTYSFERGQAALAERSDKYRKEHGQFLTPPAVARYMARQLGNFRAGDRILDPAIGSGVLACAIIEQIIADGFPRELWLDGYETDRTLCNIAQDVLNQAGQKAAAHNITVHICLQAKDFVLHNVPTTQPQLLLLEDRGVPRASTLYDRIIANPPYFKLNHDDPRVKMVSGQLSGHTNIYTLFLALAAEKLRAGGKASFIIPRSFCSGAYFSTLRQSLVEKVRPLAIHLFESRQDTFKNDAVLQENLIFCFGKSKSKPKQDPSSAPISISTSTGTSGLNTSLLTQNISITHFYGQRHGALFFRLPASDLDKQILDTIDRWPGSLNQFGLQVSTGPVVAFRAKNWLSDLQSVSAARAVPLLWMQNIKRQSVAWPVANGSKAQGILVSASENSLLVRNTNYVILRRFSAKEETRRLVAAPFLARDFPVEQVGFENHLNYIYKKGGDLSEEEVIGLSALLNSAVMDRYFRIVNGNTQVNATELRAMPLPEFEVIVNIGRKLRESRKRQNSDDLEEIVFTELQNSGFLPLEFPLFRETRITMGKIQEAQHILKELGLPRSQQNEISVLTLLVLAQLQEETPWQDAKRTSLRIHDMLLTIKENYDREYAENTRETIRRQVIHQFVQAGLVLRNPDVPGLSTNSPRTNYALSDAALTTIRSYGTEDWSQAVRAFVEAKGALLEIYQKSRQQHRVPLTLADGSEYHLSPGQHNQLQVAVIEEFGPRFAPGARLLYLGDTENKSLILDPEGFQELGIPAPNHDKLPDILLYDEVRNRLFLVEAVTSHGPVSPKRYVELEEILKVASAGRVYVSAFPDFATFKNFLTNIAWDTEVWLAEMPEHMIHFNGDRFISLYT